MKHKTSNDNYVKKIKLTKDQQINIIKYFMKTSIPRMINEKKQLKVGGLNE